MVLDFDKKTMTWDEAEVPMSEKRSTATVHEMCTEIGFKEPASVKSLNKRTVKILDADYKKADLNQVVDENIHLSTAECTELLKLLEKYEVLFDGKLGMFKTSPVELDVKPGSPPVQLRPFPVPHSRRETFKNELQRLIKIGVLRKDTESPYASPSFIFPKKNNTVRFLSDFRKVNQILVRKPYPILKILDMMQTLQGFRYATTLDLNMGYYTLRLSLSAQKICTIITPWGKYAHKRLPMGVMCAPDIFQSKMSELMCTLEYVRTYLDDLLVLTSKSYTDHLIKVERVLQRLESAGLNVHAEKSIFRAPEVEYLGYVITRDGLKPQTNKIQAILNLAPPKTVKQVRQVLGIIQYYRDLWPRRSEIIAPLTELTSTKGTQKNSNKKVEWTNVHQTAFDKMKKEIAKEVLLAYPKFDRPFQIYADASDIQMGGSLCKTINP